MARPLPRTAASALVAGLLSIMGVAPTQDAVANGDTRSLDLFHAHTRENISITFKRNGSYDRDALEKLNWFLRDWRKDEATKMAPQLFDVVWAVYREVGGSEPIKIMSAYRSAGTNAMLRRRSRAVAENSQHIQGRAMDVHIPGVSMAKAREIGMRLQRGGVGYYPTAGSPFVHLDVGSVRSWPRMPREQLERLFPDGKTVHLPADGTPLSGYQVALAEIQARGGSALDYETVTSTRGKSLWALLFGGDEGEEEEALGRGGRTSQVAARGRGRQTAPQQVAAASTQSDGDDTRSLIYAGTLAPAAAPVAVASAARAPKVEQRLTPVPEAAKVEPAKIEPAKVEPQKAEPPPLPPVAPVQIAQARAALAEESIRAKEAEAARAKEATASPIAQLLAGASPAATPADAPLPPRRPRDLVALAALNVPLPPVRPSAPIVEPAVTGALALADVPVPPARGAEALPAVITEGIAPETAAGLVRAYAPLVPERRDGETVATATVTPSARSLARLSTRPVTGPLRVMPFAEPKLLRDVKVASAIEQAAPRIGRPAGAMALAASATDAERIKPAATRRVENPSIEQAAQPVLAPAHFAAGTAVAPAAGRFAQAVALRR